MERERNENQVLLRGVAEQTPQFSHETRGRQYHRFCLAVERLSGTVDRLPVLCTEYQAADVIPGAWLEVQGQLRSFNNKSGQGRRLVLSVFARYMAPCDAQPHNELYLDGVLCKPPVFRKTPLGRDICDFILAVNRRYGRADYLPCIAWGWLAEQIAPLPVGSRLLLTGRMQSRMYRKLRQDGAAEERTAYEVSVMRLAPECRPKTAMPEERVRPAARR